MKNKISFWIGSLWVVALMGCQGDGLTYTHDFGKEMIWNEPVNWEWNIQKNDRAYTPYWAQPRS